MISLFTHLRIFGLSLLLAVTMLPTTVTAQTRPSIAALEARIATLESNNVPNLAGYLTMDLSTPSRPTLRVAGANLQVVDGTGATEGFMPNGLGNLIVGYDETDASLPAVCSRGQYTDQISCESAGGTWAVALKTGSHNVVVGKYQRYSSFGGLIAGSSNTVNGIYASVTGGFRNTASNQYAHVSGGSINTASVIMASVSGGFQNRASGNYSSVSGGAFNTASGPYGSVSGGTQNTASSDYASVSGGFNHNSNAIYDWRAGTLFETQ